MTTTATTIGTGNTRQRRCATGRCTLCPAGCPIDIIATGPDGWRAEYAARPDGGLCPRGSTLGELIGHPRRIRAPMRRERDELIEITWRAAIDEIASAVRGRRLAFIVDGNLPIEQLQEIAAWCHIWPEAGFCFAIESADHDLLIGLEAARARYLDADEIAGCDGFLIIGDPFAANPMCARHVFDRVREDRRTPIVVLDPASGMSAKFATHRPPTPPGMTFDVLGTVAAAAGLGEAPQRESAAECSTDQTMDACVAAPTVRDAARAAGHALAGCERLGVLIATAYASSTRWSAIGGLAARLAEAHGGGVAPQTDGGNALAAVRLGRQLGAMSLDDALRDDVVRVVLGVDVLGMIGVREIEILAAAAPLPNRTTRSAMISLPLALPVELGGTVLIGDDRLVKAEAAIAPPAGTSSPGTIVANLARTMGVSAPAPLPEIDPTARLEGKPPVDVRTDLTERDGLQLAYGREAMHAGCGALTGHGSWQRAVRPATRLRLAPQLVASMGLRHREHVSLRVNGCALDVELCEAPELSENVVVLSQHVAAGRRLTPTRADESGAIRADVGAAVRIEREGGAS